METTSNTEKVMEKLSDEPIDVMALLKKASPKIFEPVKDLYEFGPFLPKTQWTAIGDQVVNRERIATFNVPGEKYITLRLDGHGFSNVTKKLKRDGILEKGFSSTMAEWMQNCCTSLMEMYGCKFGYTQSDEISVIIPPASVTMDKGVSVQHPHAYSGRVLKICTLAASHVTLIWNQQLAKLCPTWQDYKCTFDCRMGCHDTFDQAMTLFLWRSYDCGVNGIADACHHQKGAIQGAKAAVGLPTDKKLEFLFNNNLLPLADHQAYGSYFVKVKRVKTVINPQTNAEVTCLRTAIEKVKGNLLNIAVNGKLIPEDESLPTESS